MPLLLLVRRLLDLRLVVLLLRLVLQRLARWRTRPAKDQRRASGRAASSIVALHSSSICGVSLLCRGSSWRRRVPRCLLGPRRLALGVIAQSYRFAAGSIWANANGAARCSWFCAGPEKCLRVSSDGGTVVDVSLDVYSSLANRDPSNLGDGAFPSFSATRTSGPTLQGTAVGLPYYGQHKLDM